MRRRIRLLRLCVSGQIIPVLVLLLVYLHRYVVYYSITLLCLFKRGRVLSKSLCVRS